MSIFGRIYDVVFGPSEADTQAFASDLDRWIAVQRRWLQNNQAFTALSRRMEAWVAGRISTEAGFDFDSDPVLSRWVALQDRVELQRQQIVAHNNTLFGWIEGAVGAGHLSQGQAEEYRRLVREATNGVGLGALAAGMVLVLAIAAALLLYVGSRVVLDHRNAMAWNERENQYVTQETSMIERAYEVALKTGVLPPIPSRTSTPEGPIVRSIAAGISGVGTVALLGVGLFLLAKLPGGRKS